MPRGPGGYTLLTMVPGGKLERSSTKCRYPKIAPKQTPRQVYQLSIPSTSVVSESKPSVEAAHSQTPRRNSGGEVKTEEGQEEAVTSKPVMSTPLKPSRSEIMEAMGSLTPFNDDDYTLLRSQQDILDITPIKGTGMTPIIKGILSQTNDLEVTPARPSKPRQCLLATPVVDRNDVSFNLDDLFEATENNEDLQNDFSYCSFSHLFSPVSKKCEN